MKVDPTQTAPEWVSAPVPEGIEALIAAGVSDRLAPLLARRGAVDPAAAEAFLEPGLEGLHDPLQMPGMQAAVERLLAARDQGERVAIVGDYDVDGVSATALLVAVFRVVGLAVEPILPERLEEGYGFQPVHVAAAADAGCRLIVTADCGSTALEAVLAAREADLEVIVTDHHLGSEVELPEWVIELNPHSPGSAYPFADLSGAGVAYKLAVALLRAADRRVDDDALLRITCLGTICDLVPLLGENRIIAARGLASLGESRSVGLRTLMRKASVKPPVRASDVGFRLGPRINAAGRLASPRPALDLLLTSDGAEAARLAETLEGLNRNRQGTERQVVEEAESRFADLSDLPPILAAWSEDWHPGVLGIAAGRIARTFYRPTLLLNVDGATAKGSGRSISGVHLYDFLSQWRQDYERFGGHSQAVGISVAVDQLERLRKRWVTEAEEQWDPEVLQQRLTYELSLAPARVDQSLLQELARLEPYGMGNRQPVLRVGALQLESAPRRFGRGHLSARAIGEDGGQVELLGWGWQEREDELQGIFEVLGSLERDRYHGGPVMRLLAARPAEAGAHPPA